LGASAVHVHTVHALEPDTLRAALADALLSPYCDEIITRRERDASRLPERILPASKVRRVRGGIDLERWRPSRAADDCTLLFLADPESAEGEAACERFAELVRALEDLFDDGRSAFGPLRYLMLTDAGLSDNMALLDRLDALGLAGRVDVQICRGGNRERFLQRACLCLYHSGNRFLPYPALESAAMGVPVLTDDRRFVREISGRLGDVRCAVEFDKTAETAQLVLDLLYDRERYEKLSGALLSAVGALYNFGDAIVPVYDAYVRGLRV
jgi:glycosyltransferase involved in cell wall biosynthesis